MKKRMNKAQTKRIVAGAIAVLLALAMIIPMLNIFFKF